MNCSNSNTTTTTQDTIHLPDFSRETSMLFLLEGVSLLLLMAIVTLMFKIRLRHRSEDLQRSQAFLFQNFDRSRTPISVLDAETYRFIDCNTAALSLYGFKCKDELIGKIPLDISARYQYNGVESKHEMIKYIQRALTEGAVVFEWRHQRDNGEIWEAEMHLVSFSISGKSYLQFSMTDITERKHAAMILQNIIDKNPLSIKILDKHGRALHINPAFTTIFGEKPQSEYSELHESYVDLPLFQELIKRVKDGETVYFPDFQFNPSYISSQLPDCNKWLRLVVFPLLDNNGVVERYVLMHEDITQKKAAESSHKETERMYASLLDNLPGFTYRCKNDSNWTVEFISNGCYQITGYHPEDFINNLKTTFQNIIDAEIQPSLRERWESCLLSRSAFEGEYRITTATGEIRWVWERGRGVFNDQGTLLFLEGFVTDITARKSAEEERVLLQEQLTQAVKMESIGRLAGGIAHDFNNMLSVIISQSEIGLLKSNPQNPLHTRLLEIKKAGLRSAELTRQLLTFARKQVINPRVIDLNLTVANMLSMLKRLIGEDIKLEWLPYAKNGLVKIDPSQLDQILANLCVNARDAIVNTGSINISTKQLVINSTGKQKDYYIKTGSYMVLSVSDTGCGMDEQTKSQIFEPFFTTKEAGKGTGLGLASVYGIVKQNQGFITVESTLGEGTVFQVYLPLYIGNVDNCSENRFAHNPAGGNESVLLVEDEAMIVDIATSMLTEFGYKVVSATTPAEALNYIKNNTGEKIDLLISDVILPGMNGSELAEQVKKYHQEIKVLYMSGYTANNIEQHGVLRRDVHFLQKPFTIDSLAQKVREAIESD